MIEQILFHNIDPTFSSDYDSFSSPLDQAEASSDNIPSDNAVNFIKLIVLHKPRGSKGLWQRVETTDKLRVTKGKGKRLKLQFLLPQGFQCDVPITEANLKIQLVQPDQSPSHASAPGSETEFVFECAKVFNQLIEVEIKLFKISKQLQFIVQVRSQTNETILGKSVEFATHNSGAVNPPAGAQHNVKIDRNEQPTPIVPSRPEIKESNEYEVRSQPQYNQDKKRKTTDYNVQSVYPATSHPEAQAMATAVHNTHTDPHPSYYPPAPQNYNYPSGYYPPGEAHVDSNGTVTNVVPGSLQVNGTVRARAFMQFSDLRLKTNIEDIVDAISIVSQLEGKRYHWRNDTVIDTSKTKGHKVIGLIAQEVQKVLPEVVHEDTTTGYLAVSYAEILPILIEAFKELLNEYKDNKDDVQQQLDDLYKKLNQLESVDGKAGSRSSFAEEVRALQSYTSSSRTKSKAAAAKAGPKSMPELPSKRHAQVCLAVAIVVSLIFIIIGIVLMATNIPAKTNNSVNKRSESSYQYEKRHGSVVWEAEASSRPPDHVSHPLDGLSLHDRIEKLQRGRPKRDFAVPTEFPGYKPTVTPTSQEPSSTTTPEPGTTSNNISNPESKGLNVKFIVGVIILVLGGTGFLIAGTTMCYTIFS